MKLGLLRNPVAGSPRMRKRWPAVLSAFGRAFDTVDLAETAAAGDTGRLARHLALDGADLVVAVGGDGTLGETVDGILSAGLGEPPHFSFVMAGTGSDFARNFPAAARMEDVPAAIAGASLRPLDVGLLTCVDAQGRVHKRHFVNIASFGVSGQTVKAVNRARRGRFLPGSLRFLYHAVREIGRYKPDRVRIRLDGEEVYAGGITVVAVANGGWFGGGMHVAPQADTADGWFDVVIVPEKSTFAILRVMHRIYFGSHGADPRILFRRAKLVEVEPLDGARPALMDCDGEAPGTIPARFEILPQALRLKI